MHHHHHHHRRRRRRRRRRHHHHHHHHHRLSIWSENSTLKVMITRSAAITERSSVTITYTLSPIKGSRLMFANNFGKRGPIFKIISPIDS